MQIDSQSVLYSQGNNDECYTPRYAVKPIIKYLNKKNGYRVNINLELLDKDVANYFQGQNTNIKVDDIWDTEVCVSVPRNNIKGHYQLQNDGTDFLVLKKEQVSFLEKKLVVWCPFDTEDSEFVKLIRESGYKVIASHIDNGQDFYTYEPEEQWDIIISNPPFTNKREIFERALSFNKPFALLMSLTWLNDSAPKQLFMEKDLQLLMFDKRIQYDNQKKITFSSAYYCYNFLSKQIIMEKLKLTK